MPDVPLITKATPRVSDAIHSRRCVRSFSPESVSADVVREMLATASRAASGGNLQPWRIYVINGSTMSRFLEFLHNRTPQTEPAYAIYHPA